RTVVLKAWTEQFGKRSYMVRTGGRSGVPIAALQPLNRLELVVDERPDRDLQVVRELRIERPYMRVPFDAVRGALALFVQEVLYKVLREESPDAAMHVFVEEVLETMDTTNDVRHFPLVFLLQLSGHLGFFPETSSDGHAYFDLGEGHFVADAHPHSTLLGPPLSHAFITLLDARLEDMHLLDIPAPQRRELLDHILLYFRLHLDGLGELRSPAVLHEALG
ncbi:MAG TPA: DNA repair protein RecO C-terminal domain-containing protein, partial [Flavobacteriales bacterium]|nr:DNA repair protein RecO C-terminal domain-containing protein [Flavobacteriales bacterium]